MKIKKNGRIAWGVTLVVFGILLFLRAYRKYLALPDVFLDFRNYPIYAGIIFMIFNKNKNPGLVLLLVGTLLRLSYEIHWIKNATTEIWGALMIVAGILMIVQVYRNDANKNK
jgi:hypothetical protein